MDFQQCYRTDNLLKQFKEKIEHKSYPPRFKIAVKVKTRLFFSQQQGLNFTVNGGKRVLKRNITIPAAMNGMC